MLKILKTRIDFAQSLNQFLKNLIRTLLYMKAYAFLPKGKLARLQEGFIYYTFNVIFENFLQQINEYFIFLISSTYFFNFAFVSQYMVGVL